MTGHILDFYMYTYAGPEIYMEPMLEFMGHICRTGYPTGLPIGILWHDVPREWRYNDTRWARFEQRVRQVRVLTCMIIQFSRPGMSMVSFSGEELDPFTLDAQFVPADGIPPSTRNRALELAVMKGLKRYPTNLHLKLVTGTFGLRPSEDFQQCIALFDTMAKASNAAYACVELGNESGDYGSIPSGPELFDDHSLVEQLDNHIPGIFWRMLLGPKHLAKLGGKAKVLHALSECRIEDLSDDAGDRLLVQLTNGPDDFGEWDLDHYRPFFEPLLRKEDSLGTHGALPRHI